MRLGRKVRVWIIVLTAMALGTSAGLGRAAERLLGSWCDDTGYRIDLGPDRISFRDRQVGDPPDGTDLTFGEGVAVYRQDFRRSAWPHLDIIDCTLRLTGSDSAEESCRGAGYGFVPYFALKRCPTDHIS